MPSHQDLRLLTYFVQIVRAGSIRRAAEALRLSPAVVSEALSRLEAELGVTLLHRTTRSMRLTPVGEVVLHQAVEMVNAGDAALRLGRGVAEVPSGDLHMTLPGELSLAWFPPKLRAFERAHPDVRVSVAIDDNAIALEQSAFDMAIRALFAREAGPEAGTICHIPLACVCAPHLLGRRAALSKLLGGIGLIGASSSDVGDRTIWVADTRKGQKLWSQVRAPCRFHATEHVVGHRLALEGFGAALLMRPTVEADLKAGRLAEVSTRHDFGCVAVSALLRDKHPTAAARAMRDHLLLQSV